MFKLLARVADKLRSQPAAPAYDGADLDRMRDAIDELAKLRNAVDDLAKTVYSDHPSTSLTCWETDALARVLARCGHLDRATDLLVGHSYHDDEEGSDSHHFEADATHTLREFEMGLRAQFLAIY